MSSSPQLKSNQSNIHDHQALMSLSQIGRRLSESTLEPLSLVSAPPSQLCIDPKKVIDIDTSLESEPHSKLIDKCSHIQSTTPTNKATIPCPLERRPSVAEILEHNVNTSQIAQVTNSGLCRRPSVSSHLSDAEEQQQVLSALVHHVNNE